MTTSATVSISSNSTSLTEARMVVVRSVRTWTWTLAGKAGLQLRQELIDAVDDGDDVGAGLALDVDDDGGLAVHPGGLLRVFGGVDDGGDVGGADGGAVAIGDDDGQVVGAGEKLVVGVDGVGLARAVERALGLVDVGGGERRCADLQG